MFNLLLGVLSILLAIAGQEFLESSQMSWSIGCYVAALCLALIAFRGLRLPDYHARADELPVSTASPSPWIWLPALLFLIALAASAWGVTIFRAEYERAIDGWRLYLGSALLFVVGAFLLQYFRPAPPDLRTHKIPLSPDVFKWIEWLLLALIVFGGVWMRLFRFESLPFGMWYDEAVAINLAERVLVDPTWRPLFPGAINVTGHYVYLVSRALAVIDNPTLAVRSVSFIFGIGSILAAYIAGRELFHFAAEPQETVDKGQADTASRPRRTFWSTVIQQQNPDLWIGSTPFAAERLAALMGLTVAAIVAFSRWHVNFSRIGMYNIATPFFALLSVGLLLRAIRRNNYFEYALAGVAFGFGLCFYTAFFFFVAAVGLYLLCRIAFESRFLKEQWVGLALMTTLIIMLTVPLAFFAYDKPDVYFNRTKETSLLRNVAEEQRIPALIQNTKKHLLMFNYIGDPNGRHNLPGNPMLDSISGALLVLGVGLCLRWLWRSTAILLLGWFGFALLGGILTLDFEAPQSLRSIAAQPAAYLLAMVPLYFIGQLWRAQSATKRWLSSWSLGGVLLLLLVPFAYENYDVYFNKQAAAFATWNAFSTPETLAAGLFNQIYAAPSTQTDADLEAEAASAVDTYVISYFIDHPTFKLLADEPQRAKRLSTTATFPLSVPPDRDVYLLVNADSRSIFEEAKSYYPNARYTALAPPAVVNGPPVVFQVHLSPKDLAEIQGLSAEYYATPDWSGEITHTQSGQPLRYQWPQDAPLPVPFSVEWSGVLNITESGTHSFYVQAPDHVEIYVDQARIWAQAGNGAFALDLAKGNHAVRVRAVGGAGPFSLSWQTPISDIHLMPSEAFYMPSVPANGLLGRYYPNGEWSPPEAFTQIDPNFDLYFHTLPLKRPYTVEWSGQIVLPEDGTYTFGLRSVDESSLLIGGQNVISPTVPGQYEDAQVELKAGAHDLLLRFADRADHSQVHFYWQPPNGRHEIVPTEVLFPVIGAYEVGAVPHSERLIFHDGVPAAPTIDIPILPADVRYFEGDWSQLAGIAIGKDGTIFLTDGPNQRVLALNEDGSILAELNEANSGIAIEEPVDLAVDAQGNLYILDAALARILIFDEAGRYVRTLLTDPDILERSRGLYVDFQDRVWVANTPWGRVIALNQEGERVEDIPVRPGEDSQPVDVAVGADGKIFVTDASLHRLIRFAADGRREQAWELAPSVTLFGPHLAISEDGAIYLSAPNDSKIALLAADGQRIGEWPLRGPRDALAMPVGLAVDADGRIWYVDNHAPAIGVLEPKP